MATIKALLNLDSYGELDLSVHKNFPSIFLYKFSLNSKNTYGILCDVMCQNKLSDVIVKGESEEIPFENTCYFSDYSGGILSIFENIATYSKPRYEKDDYSVFVINDTKIIQNLAHLFSPEKLYMTKNYESYISKENSVEKYTPMFLYITI